MKRLSFIFILWIISLPAWALYVESGVFTLESDKAFFSRNIVNDTSTTNLYTIYVYRIERPGRKEKLIPKNDGELLYTPLKKIISPHSSEYFKVFYNGAKDDHERYYRVVIKEYPSRAVKVKDKNHNIVSPVVALDTVMVVRPRELHFSYDYDPLSGTLKNSGNTYFKVLLNRSCTSTGESAETFNLLPGEEYKGEWLRGEHRKFIIAFDRYIKLGEQCFKQ